ncbi:hypothetical protein [Paenibacillus polymyxa]|uniref:hypothetical protein n=1 Tax=Paenibacillus polymyxa TaxID=1406 RepID=UPI00287F4341|nr:hypothetical protein [Paenibacillus polymyxa]
MSEITGTTLILFLFAKGLSLQSANFLLYSVLFVWTDHIGVHVLAQVFGGLAICLQSGSLESWVVENSERKLGAR